MTRYQTSKIIKIILTSLLILGVIIYVIFNSRVFIAGPQIIIETPENGQVFKDSGLIKIKGKVFNMDKLELNGRPISTDEAGNLEESLLLSPGYNIIWIIAKDRFEREESKKLEIVYQGELQSVEFQSLEEVASSSATSSEF